MSLQYIQTKHTSKIQTHHQAGFTIIELIVALGLGLIVSAAALKIYYTSALSSNVQQSGSNMIGDTVFGADDLIGRIQHANLGAIADTANTGGYFLNHRTALGGIVLTAPTNLSIFGTEIGTDPNKIIVPNNLRGLNLGGNRISGDLLSKNEVSTTYGDQLTIQYQVREDNKTDCIGRTVPKDFYVIERYFVRAGGLACAAAIYQYKHSDAQNNNGIDISSYTFNGTAVNNDLAGNGEIVIPNVEYMRVLLGITNSKGFAYNPSELTLRYLPIPASSQLGTVFGENPNTGTTSHRITAVQIGLLMTAARPTNSQKDITTHQVLDRSVPVTADGKIRSVYVGNVFIRNARGKA